MVQLKYLMVWTTIGFLVSCSSATGPNDQEPQTRVLSLGTHGVASLVYGMGAGMSALLSEVLPNEVKVVASSGPTEWLPMFSTGEIDLGILNSWDAQKAFRGQVQYEQLSRGSGFNLRLLTSGTRALTGIVTRSDLGIQTASDLEGKRVVTSYTGTPAVTAIAEACFLNLGLSSVSVQSVAMPSVNAGVQSLIEGRVEVTMASLGMGALSELDASHGAHYLSLDPSPAAVAQMQSVFPAKVVQVEPGPGRTGINQPTYLMQYDFYLVAREDLEAEIVQKLLEALWDHNDRLTETRQLQDWKKEHFLSMDNTVPYHEGAIQFFQEKGIWDETMSQRQKALTEGLAPAA